MKAQCQIYRVTNRRQLLTGRLEDFTWSLFHDPRRRVAGGTFSVLDYQDSVFVRVPKDATLNDVARLVYPALGREQPHAVCELDHDTWIIAIQPDVDYDGAHFLTDFTLFAQSKDHFKRSTIAPLIVS